MLFTIRNKHLIILREGDKKEYLELIFHAIQNKKIVSEEQYYSGEVYLAHVHSEVDV